MNNNGFKPIDEDSPSLISTPPKNPSMFTKIFSTVTDKPFNVMEPEYLQQLIYSSSNLIIFDCRYDYEYKGGHIEGAELCPNQQELQYQFFKKKVENVIIVFHCEYSVNRAPYQWQQFRCMDRQVNEQNYPLLWYPNIFVLRGGYREFHEQYPELCGGYVKMINKQQTRRNQTDSFQVKYYRRGTRESVWRCSPLFSVKRLNTM
ncbi:protein-tyrosine-phosphatase [Entamoeba marina]